VVGWLHLLLIAPTFVGMCGVKSLCEGVRMCGGVRLETTTIVCHTSLNWKENSLLVKLNMFKLMHYRCFFGDKKGSIHSN
jgi:hypothetical protein